MMRECQARTAILLTTAVLLCNGQAVSGAEVKSRLESIERIYRFENDGSCVVTRTFRARPQIQPGRSEEVGISQAYKHEYSRLRLDYCRILKPAGVQVSIDTVRTKARMAEASNGNWKAKALAVPGVERGDILEYRFVEWTRKPVKPGDFWRWEFRTEDADAETVLLDLPQNRRVALHIYPQFPARHTTAGGRSLYRWILQGPHQGRSPLFALSSLTWKELGDWFYSFYNPRAAVTPAIRETAERLSQGAATPYEKLKAICNYVSSSVRYRLNPAAEIDGLQPRFAGDVLASGYGDCKDHHTLFTALLRAVGIRALDVWITPDSGVPLPDIPFPGQFEHGITLVQIGEEEIWVDTTPPLQPMGLLPGMRGRQAFVSEYGKSRMVLIPPSSPMPDLLHVKITGRVDANGSITAEKKVEARGWFEWLLRMAFSQGNAKAAEMMPASGGIEGLRSVSAPASSSPADLARPFSAMRSSWDTSFFEPGTKEKQLFVRVAPFLAMAPDESAYALAQSTRGPLDREELVEMEIGPGLEVLLPMPVKAVRRFGAYESSYAFAEGRLRLERKLHITRTEVLLKHKAEWEEVHEIIRKDRDQPVVLHRVR